jgi:branched-chain amino acid aminotransferase group I
MADMVYINGSLVPLDRARVSVMDYGFLFGYGVFETMRAYHGHVFCLGGHLDRILGSALNLGITVDRGTLSQAIPASIQANGLTEARVRLIITIGEGSLTPDARTCTSPTVVVMAAPYHPYPAETYGRGWQVVISGIRRNSQSPLPGMKTANFMESMLAKQEARAMGVDDAVMLNDRGLVAEATSSNIFIVSAGMLKTPKLGGGLLPGVTRGVVMDIAGKLGVKHVEADILPRDLTAATEAFLTNSMVEIMPLVAVNGERIGDGKPGQVTKQLMKAYTQRTMAETR